jgi:hypothetical protein
MSYTEDVPWPQFEKWPSTVRRYNEEITITEKIDGTNGAILVNEDGDVAAQSRNRLVTPGNDNHGFAAWVFGNGYELGRILGPGRHFGEWWGHGIARGYGLNEKRFSLFNTARWATALEETAIEPELNLYHVPVLARGVRNTDAKIDEVTADLHEFGSVASPGFMRPEGVCVFHHSSRQVEKVFGDGTDMLHKWEQ